MNWKKFALSSCVAIAVIVIAGTAQAQSRGHSGGGARGAGGMRGGSVGSTHYAGRNWNNHYAGRNWNNHGGGQQWHRRYPYRYNRGYYYGYPYWGFYPYAWGYGYPYYGASFYYDGYGYNDGRVYEGRAVGSAGSVVADVQQELARAGYYRGSIDGVIGTQTRNAIRAYERRNGLRVDGRIDSELLDSMGLS